MGTTAAIIKITIPYDAIAIAIAYYLDCDLHTKLYTDELLLSIVAAGCTRNQFTQYMHGSYCGKERR